MIYELDTNDTPCECWSDPITDEDVVKALDDLLRLDPEGTKYSVWDLWDMIGQFGCEACLNAALHVLVAEGKLQVTSEQTTRRYTRRSVMRSPSETWVPRRSAHAWPRDSSKAGSCGHPERHGHVL